MLNTTASDKIQLKLLGLSSEQRFLGLSAKIRTFFHSNHLVGSHTFNSHIVKSQAQDCDIQTTSLSSLTSLTFHRESRKKMYVLLHRPVSFSLYASVPQIKPTCLRANKPSDNTISEYSCS